MDILQKYLIIIYGCLSITYGIGAWEYRANDEALIAVVIMLVFVNIGVIAAFFSRKWHGQLLLYANFLFVGLIPFVLGTISLWVDDQLIKNLLKYASGTMPLIFFVLSSYIELRSGSMAGMQATLKPAFQSIVQAVYWLTVFLYTTTHLTPLLEKIEKKV